MKMEIKPTRRTTDILMKVVNEKPNAFAIIDGPNNIYGTVCFYDYLCGVIMLYEINGLPKSQDCQGGFFGFHIHEGKTCLNNTKIAYEKTKGHLNPQGCEHPFHLGDLPPLCATQGKAWSMVYIDKLNSQDIMGRTMVIHANADDFHTQPSGNSGEKIACGVIKKFQ